MNWTREEAQMYTRAEALAKEAHAGQIHSGEVYENHCRRVVGYLFGYGYTDVDLLAAAWLHDVVEDTPVTLERVEAVCGATVRLVVWACTGTGDSRRERNARIYEKLSGYPFAAPIKVADRIDNVERAWRTRDARLFMYYREHDRFRAAIRFANEALIDTPIFMHLDRLLGRTP